MKDKIIRILKNVNIELDNLKDTMENYDDEESIITLEYCLRQLGDVSKLINTLEDPPKDVLN